MIKLAEMALFTKEKVLKKVMKLIERFWNLVESYRS